MTGLSVRALACAVALLAAPRATAQEADYSQSYSGIAVEMEKVQAPVFPSNEVDISTLGAKGDGVTLCTDAFTQAVKRLSKLGGGTVVVPRGVWLTGPIVLKSNIRLHVSDGAIIVFSPDKSLYVNEKGKHCVSMIRASKAENIGITGRGIIDGNGKYWRVVKRSKVSDVEWNDFKKMGGYESEDGKLWFPYGLNNVKNVTDSPEAEESLRYDLVNFRGCKNIIVKDVTIQNSPRFHLHPCQCENLIIDGVTVRCPWNAQNGDGIDLSSCRRVIVTRATVDVGDDGICMKAGAGEKGVKEGPVADVLIQDCKVFRAHGGFVVGSEFSGGIERLVVRRCSFSGTDTGLRFKSAVGRGGKIKDMVISDVTMNDIKGEAVIFSCTYVDKKYKSADGGKPASFELKPFTPEFSNILIENVVCRESAIAVKAEGAIFSDKETGESLRTIHGITIRNSTFFYTEADKQLDANSELKLEGVNFLTF